MRIALATRNPDKVREIQSIMSEIDVELVPADAFPGLPEVIEDGSTLEENALKKARAVREYTGLSALADDTGLEVDALGGAPGVYSSRYAGEGATYDDNNRKLLEAMTGVGPAERTARFRCVMALTLYRQDRPGGPRDDAGVVQADDEGRSEAFVTEGILEGRIAMDKRGTHGFGFDPVFEVARLGKTLAELEPAEKNRISHRYRALLEMRELLLRQGLVTLR